LQLSTFVYFFYKTNGNALTKVKYSILYGTVLVYFIKT
jgi:hypothetical protein